MKPRSEDSNENHRDRVFCSYYIDGRMWKDPSYTRFGVVDVHVNSQEIQGLVESSWNDARYRLSQSYSLYGGHY